VAAGRQTRYAGGDYSSESLMLTGDLNVIDVQWIVQFRVEDPVRYLFKVREQRQTFRDIAEAIMRRVVGNRLGSDVLTVGRVGVATEVKEEMQQILSEYETGIRLVTVELQDVTPPDPVKPAFNEVNEARQDLERMVNQAQEQANKVIPRAAGEAKQAIAEAEGYATERVNQARGEASRFSSVLSEYQRVPEVTRRRLYLEAMSEVLADAKTVYIVDSEQRALIPWLSLESGQKPPPMKDAKEEPRS
jgi:modulator of FtsH protease HflK